MGSVHILHYHVEGGRGFRTRLIALIMPLGGWEGVIISTSLKLCDYSATTVFENV